MKKKDQTIVAKDIIFLYFCTFFKTFYRLQKKKKIHRFNILEYNSINNLKIFLRSIQWHKEILPNRILR